MKGFVRPAAGVLTVLLCLGAAASLAGPGGLERTLFKDLPPADPAREIVRTILDSPFYSMRAGFTAKAWAAEGFRDAWERARSYFPGKTYFVVPGTHFMTHGFDPDGKLFMEVHESAYLTLCVENRRTFTAGAIVGEYGRMRGQADLREAAAFREKMGRLEPFFLDASGQRRSPEGAGRNRLRRIRRQAPGRELSHARRRAHARGHPRRDGRRRRRPAPGRLRSRADAGPMGRAAGLHGRDRLSRTLLRMGRERSRRGVGPDRRGAREARSFQEAAEAPPRRGPGGIRKAPGRDLRRGRARPPADARDLAIGPAHRRPAREFPRRLRPGPAARRGRRAARGPGKRRRTLHRRCRRGHSGGRARPPRPRRDAGRVERMGGGTPSLSAARHRLEGRGQKGRWASPGRTRRPTGPVSL